MKQILITNDDGIKADGIVRLARAAKRYGEVWVAAPLTQRSAASHSITLHNSIDVHEDAFPVDGIKAFAVNGTPADCVRIASLNILPHRPDIVLAGINYGYNAGTDVQYSATVGAAMEAVFQNIPAVALSEDACDDHRVTDLCLDNVLAEVLDWQETGWKILNVNFPSCAPQELRGILRGRLASKSSVFKDRYSCASLPDGGKSYMVNGTHIDESEDDSDLRALYDHYISIGTISNIG